MSPEQSRGGDVGAPSDQFSFAVALYEALYDRRPFRGAELGELRQQQVDGALRKQPVHASVSASLRGAISRALAPRPEDRFPSLSPLIAELEKDPRRRRRRIAAVAGGLALTALAVTAGATLRSSTPPCEGTGDQLAAVWNPEVRQSIQQAFSRSQLSYADATFKKLATTIDDYAAGWEAMQQLARADQQSIDRLREAGGPMAQVIQVPLFSRDIHDVTVLGELGSYLFGRAQFARAAS